MRIGFLPFFFKFIGAVFLLTGAVMAYYVLALNFKPDYLDSPVFAIYSAYVEKTIFGMTYTNLADELALVMPLIGLAFIAFSRHRKEAPEFEIIRRKALVTVFIINTVLLVILNLLVFGTGFIAILLLNLYAPLLIYLVVYQYYYLKRKIHTDTS